MTDHANELRRHARKIPHPQGETPGVMLRAADEIERLAARLEATEEDRARFIVEMGRLCAQCDALRLRIKAAEKERDALRARIEAIKPVAWLDDGTCRAGSKATAHRVVTNETKRDMPASVAASFSVPLGVLPGAQTQPAPSTPEGWLRAIDEALIVAHIGMANADDTYAQAKSKLDTLIGLHVDIATDPAVNGGWKLVPTAESRHPGIHKMLNALHAVDNTPGASEWESYAAFLAATPEVKP